jgi:peptidylprolyl isomerase
LQDHWHVAYGVFGCTKYLDPIDSNNDPVGIHTHADGIIHVHPFPKSATGQEEATGARAVLGVFFDAVSLKVSAKQISMPGGLSAPRFAAGDLCAGKPGRVHVYSYRSTSDKRPTEITVDPAKIPLRDRAILVFAFTAEGAKAPPAPPSAAGLDDLSDVPPPALTPQELAALPVIGPRPTIEFPTKAPKKLTKKDLVVGKGPTAKIGVRPYVRIVLGTLSDHKTLEALGWGPDGPGALAKLGKGLPVPGIDTGIQGMKVGGRRLLVIPPDLAFGAKGTGDDVKPNETLVLIVDLVALK